MKNWHSRQKKVPWQGEPKEDPIIQAILTSRSITSSAGIVGSLASILPPEGFIGARQAAEVLADALALDQDICIIGDYDADGATACSLMLLFLQALGARVRFQVPNRTVHGYGMSVALLESMQLPDLLVTVDNGINALAACEYAQQRGVGVVITDHHLPGECLPKALAIANPNAPDEPFADKCLSGVGVAWYVMVLLRQVLRERGFFAKRSMPNCADYLDLVALGTVADLVPLTFLNRTLVNHGLRRLRQNPRPGMLALVRSTRCQIDNISSQDCAFHLAPRLNAAGRLADMTIGIQCLIAQDECLAADLAGLLNSMNEERKSLQQEAINQALNDLDATQLAHVVYNECWHEGIVGLVAARIKEVCRVPVVALTRAESGQIKGSVRSVPGVHIRDLLADIDRQDADLMSSFGGHAMAAGLTLSGSVATFRQHFVAKASAAVQEQGVEPGVYDAILPSDYLTIPFAERLQTLCPWGQACPEPVFMQRFTLLSWREVRGQVAQLQLEMQGVRFRGVMFKAPAQPVAAGESIELLFTLQVDSYQGSQRLQLLVIECAHEVMELA